MLRLRCLNCKKYLPKTISVRRQKLGLCLKCQHVVLKPTPEEEEEAKREFYKTRARRFKESKEARKRYQIDELDQRQYKIHNNALVEWFEKD